RDVCSATALRIATLSAAVPLTLPIMSFLARTMVPGARPHHLAEVMLGGLLRETVPDVRRAGEDQGQYEMHDGGRGRRLPRTTSGETPAGARRPGMFRERRPGPGFGAPALPPPGGGGRPPPLDPRAAGFAQVAARVLQRVGVAPSDGDEGT